MKDFKWIWYANKTADRKEKLFFRKSFRLDSPPGELAVHVSADSRYILFVNGSRVCTGPCKTDACRKFYETADIAPFLRGGENVLAVTAVKYPLDEYGSQGFENGPVSLSNTARGGLALWTDADAGLDTGSGWKVLPDASYAFAPAILSKYAGDMEDVDGSRYPDGWDRPGFDDSAWGAAVELCGSAPFREGGVLYPWQLEPRNIPLLPESGRPFSRVMRGTDGIAWEALLQGGGAVIPPHTEAFVELDAGVMMTAYVRTLLDAEEALPVAFLYAECYFQDIDGGLQKGVRDDVRGRLAGETDRYRTRKGPQAYEPFAFRTFRFLRIEVATGEKPLAIRGIRLRQTGYPLAVSGRVSFPRRKWQGLWDTSLRTLSRCMHETYEDCPFYEQMQYTMDSCLQMKYTYSVSRDDRLARNAIRAFHASQRADGMISCIAPANMVQIIPGFSLFFIDMLYDHYWYFGDKELLRDYMGTALRILRYFEKKTDPATGLVRDCGYWEFVDWVDGWSGNNGCPNSAAEAYNYIYSLMYAYALKKAVFLLRALGYADQAEEKAVQYQAVKAAANRLIWDEKDGLYKSSPEQRAYCQHAQIWAVLSEVAQGKRAADIMRRCLKSKALLPCSYCMSFYLFRALEQVGLYEKTHPLWDIWFALLDEHLTTWPEDNVSQRSDCHGWGSIALYEMAACVLGVKPLEPGMGRLLIEPKLLSLAQVQGAVPAAHGVVEVKRTVEGNAFRLEVTLPEGSGALVRLPDGEHRIAGPGDFSFTSPLADLVSAGESSSA